MLNREIINPSIPFLQAQDSVSQALLMMDDLKLTELPVIDHDVYLGMAFESDLLNEDDGMLLQELVSRFSSVSVNSSGHFLEAVQAVSEYQLSMVPVVDPDKHYVGAIGLYELVQQLGKFNGTADAGGIIVLEMDNRNFSFSEISKLVETNDARITHLNCQRDPSTDLLLVTLKLNKFEISDIIATFQRYEYQIKFYFGEELFENELRSNYHHLMNYLNI